MFITNEAVEGKPGENDVTKMTEEEGVVSWQIVPKGQVRFEREVM